MPARRKTTPKADQPSSKAPPGKPAKGPAAKKGKKAAAKPAKSSNPRAGVERARRAVARAPKKTLIGSEPGDVGVEKERELEAAAAAHQDPRAVGGPAVDPAPGHRNTQAENYDTFRQRRVGRLNVMINWFRRAAKPKQK